VVFHGLIFSLLGPKKASEGIAAHVVQVNLVMAPTSLLQAKESVAELVSAQEIVRLNDSQDEPKLQNSVANIPPTSALLPYPVQDVFLKSSELDQQPHPLLNPTPIYPPHAQINNLSGWVRLLIYLDEDGNVLQTSVLESDPPDVFDEAAISAFRITPFSPGMKQGNPVKSRLVIKVNFDSQSVGQK
jgi:TonB family protein